MGRGRLAWTGEESTFGISRLETWSQWDQARPREPSTHGSEARAHHWSPPSGNLLYQWRPPAPHPTKSTHPSDTD